MQLNDKRPDEGIVVPIAITTAFTIVVICLIVWAMFTPARGADNTAQCLSREQAQAKYPRQWLYWHTKDHCWDNVRTYATPDRRAKGGKIRRTPVLDTDGNEVRPVSAPEIDNLQYRDEAEKRLRTCCWPVPTPFAPWHDRIDGNL